ncbi:MAG: hypothetical protein IJ735_01160, partial [Clostridia bacterium]|nr:hypothetical protein [Clostridia bacterium]
MKSLKVVRTVLSILLVALLVMPILQSCGNEPIGGLPPRRNYPLAKEKIQKKMNPDYSFLFPMEDCALSVSSPVQFYRRWNNGEENKWYLYENDYADGYRSTPYSLSKLCDFSEPVQKVMEDISADLDGYKPLDVYPNAELLDSESLRNVVTIWVQAVVTTEKDATDVILGERHLMAVGFSSTAKTESELYIGENTVPLTVYCGNDLFRSIYSTDRSDRSSDKVDATSLWEFAHFTYNNVVYGISIPCFLQRLIYSNPKQASEDDGKARFALGEENVHRA